MNKIPLTHQGYQQLEKELKRRKTKVRAEIIEAIATARAHGDLRENAEYHAACEQQGFNEGRIRELEHVLSSAQVVDPERLKKHTRIVFAATVHLKKHDTNEELRYQIVGDLEADIQLSRISISSPLARVLIGKSSGDVVSLQLPDNEDTYTIVRVEYV